MSFKSNPYRVLNVLPDASEEEVNAAYSTLKAKYSADRFLEGEAGARAAKRLTELEDAYQDIQDDLHVRKVTENFGSMYGEIETLIKSGNLDMAQRKLDEVHDRTAEWHYLQSVLFYRKNWQNESKKQLELAVHLEPNNTKYREALTKLTNIIDSKNAFDIPPQQNSGQTQNNMQQNMNNNNGQYQQQRPVDQQMGGVSNCCCQLCIADQCCECMGGDLISCC